MHAPALVEYRRRLPPLLGHLQISVGTLRTNVKVTHDEKYYWRVHRGGISRRIRIKRPLSTVPYVHPYKSTYVDLPTGFDSVVRLLLSRRRSHSLPHGCQAATLLATGIGFGPSCLGTISRFRIARLHSVAAFLSCKNSTCRKEQHHGDANRKPFHLACPIENRF